MVRTSVALKSRQRLGINPHICIIFAAKEKINGSYVSRVLWLTLQAPEIVEAILDGRQSAEATLPTLMAAFPVEWERQAG